LKLPLGEKAFAIEWDNAQASLVAMKSVHFCVSSLDRSADEDERLIDGAIGVLPRPV